MVCGPASGMEGRMLLAECLRVRVLRASQSGGNNGGVCLPYQAFHRRSPYGLPGSLKCSTGRV